VQCTVLFRKSFQLSGETEIMISPLVGHIILGIYAALLAVGGIMGFVKARSRASLISGLISAVVAVIALGLAKMGSPWGFRLGLALAIVLFVIMGYRYATKGRKFMPSGLLTLISLVVLGVMVLVIDWTV
jgi:uncharacterized membrane protein (UPF0136 family)